MKYKLLLFMLVGLLLVHGAMAISISASIDPSTNVTTTNTFDCQVTVTATGTLTSNITWYHNGTAHASDNETLLLYTGVQNTTTTTGRIEAADTTKGSVWICQVTVSNGTDTNASNSSSITISNSAPVLTYPITTQTVYEDSAVGPIMATASDPDGDAIVAFISSDLNSSHYGSSLFTIASNGTISFTPTVDDVGNHTMALLASDGSLIGGRNVVYEVIAVNDTPVLDFIPSYGAVEGAPIDINITASDEENDDINYSITTTLSSIQITKINSTLAVINFTSGAPVFADGGVWSVTVWAMQFDNASHNDSQTFTLTVNTTNQIPQFTNWSTPNGTQELFYQINVSVNDTDPADEIIFNVTSPCGITNPWTITTLANGSTSASAQINATNLTNNHIVCRNITITATDIDNISTKATINLSLLLNLTNTNDAPIVNETSVHASNTGGSNISNLSAATDIAFTYFVNATDIDSLTYEGEVLNYTDNTTLFDINDTTGEITFTPNSSVVGNHTVNITVTDDGGLSHSRALFIEVINNSVPSIATLMNITCLEDANCSYQINYSDADTGDTLTHTVVLTSFSLPYNNTASGTLTQVNGTNNVTVYRNFTNDIQGNYTYNITVTDSFGATDSVLWTIFVNNTNDAPFFDNDLNRSEDTLEMPDPVVIGFNTVWYINASDDDFNVTNESINASIVITGPNTSLFNISKVSSQQFLINFTAYEPSIGDYTVNVTVTDDDAASSTQSVNFTVYNQSQPPVVQTVSPFYNSTLGGLDLGYESASTLGGSTAITLSEGSSYTFNVTWSDADDTASNVTVYWYRDGTLLQSSPATGDIDYDLTLDYFSAGTYTYVVNVTDFTFQTDSFQWNVTVSNVNRQPTFTGSLANRAVNATTSLTDYLNGFVDPDDDLDSNGQIDGSEVNNLVFTATNTSLLTISFSGDDVDLVPLEDGNVQILYTATDSGSLSATSNNVTYNVTVPEDEQTSGGSGGSSGGGGGGGGGSTSVVIPVSANPEPYSIEIVTPQPLSIYYNQTIAVPLELGNPSEQTLHDITLSASTDTEDLIFEFSETFLPELVPNQQVNVTLFVTNYREPGSYEIKVTAAVDDPEFNDTAIVFINSLDQSQDGRAIESRVTFARDLLAANPECAELNELIDQAQRAIATRQLSEASGLLDTIMDGCRYLVSQAAQREEVPAGYNLEWLLQYRYANYVLAGLIILVLGIGALLITHYISSHREDE